MSRRAVAEATLAGQVNDWPSVALEHASDVVALCEEADAVARQHSAQVEALRADIAALEERIVATVAAADATALDLQREQVARAAIATALQGVTTAGINLNARIVERPDNAFVFAYGSRGVIESFRKTIGV